ncbi:hypothetical protein BGAL_0201g00060 [Botrytis galanthina]|uniref:Uncharacterized protein n=1 Tax=Botrytis galanthina TaxID=278940 RepID=A0A4S8QVH1_9HELO|nr:hypothetical protein BGAL_0201g00060 [Botrytis galanthina]
MIFANNPKSSNSDRILDIYNPNREYLSDNDDMIDVSELNTEQRQEIAQLRVELAEAHNRVATLEERAIHNNIRNEGQLLLSEERHGYQIQARDIHIQQLKRDIQNIRSAGAALVLLAIAFLRRSRFLCEYVQYKMGSSF